MLALGVVAVVVVKPVFCVCHNVYAAVCQHTQSKRPNGVKVFARYLRLVVLCTVVLCGCSVFYVLCFVCLLGVGVLIRANAAQTLRQHFEGVNSIRNGIMAAEHRS